MRIKRLIFLAYWSSVQLHSSSKALPFVKIIREWNDLPANVVEVGNLRRFKIALKSYMCVS